MHRLIKEGMRLQGQNLYFIAIIPPGKICDDIEVFKKDFAGRFAAKEALKKVAHITLKTPFSMPESNHAGLLQWFNHLSPGIGPFPIELKDFGMFDNSYRPVVYVNPVANNQLYSLQKEILRQFYHSYPDVTTSGIDLKFSPHITVAYRDLTLDKFRAAWNEYQTKKYSSAFEVNNFHLLQHDTKKWNIIETQMLLAYD